MTQHQREPRDTVRRLIDISRKDWRLTRPVATGGSRQLQGQASNEETPQGQADPNRSRADAMT